MKTKIRIISMPPGFPPESIREHWVGIEIPLDDPNTPCGLDCDFLYDPLTIQKFPDHLAYIVNAYDALQELYKKKPEFESWFQGQGLNPGPESVGQPFGQWGFSAACCELIDGYT